MARRDSDFFCTTLSAYSCLGLGHAVLSVDDVAEEPRVLGLASLPLALLIEVSDVVEIVDVDTLQRFCACNSARTTVAVPPAPSILPRRKSEMRNAAAATGLTGRFSAGREDESSDTASGRLHR